MEKGEEHFPIVNRLHTDVLQEKYGPIVADVLRHDSISTTKDGSDRIREARLVDKENILRTYALTFLTYDKENKEISRIDDEIRSGGLIGETFRNHGYTIKKNVIDVFIMDIPKWMREDFKVESDKAKARLTEFYAKDNKTTPVIYGIVLEVYSPDFKNPKDGINQIDKDQINPLTEALQNSGVPADEIRENLDRASQGNEWNDLKDKYERAQEISKETVKSLHTKIDNYLKK